MSSMQQFDKWSHRARWESAPTPDVSVRVLRRLEGALPAPVPLNGWLIGFTAATAAAALLCAWVGYAAWIELAGPSQTLLHELSGWGMI